MICTDTYQFKMALGWRGPTAVWYVPGMYNVQHLYINIVEQEHHCCVIGRAGLSAGRIWKQNATETRGGAACPPLPTLNSQRVGARVGVGIEIEQKVLRELICKVVLRLGGTRSIKNRRCVVNTYSCVDGLHQQSICAYRCTCFIEF